MQQLSEQILNSVITKRPAISHKATFGKVLLVGGNQNYGGAIIMSALACVNAGAGLVTCACAKENLTALHSVVAEAMFVNFFDKVALANACCNNDVIVIGPGLGTDERAYEIFLTVMANCQEKQTLIIDGSAVTLLATYPALLSKIQAQNVIYTPHQMEWQRLSGIEISKQDSWQLNQAACNRLNAWVVLKKHHTQIYHPKNQCYELPIGGPYMATGGMGDTLAGILAAIIAQFNSPLFDKINAAVYLHSAVAQELSLTNYVVLPTKLSTYLPVFMHKICFNH